MAFSFLAFSCTQPLALRNLLTIATLRVSLKLPARPVETYLGNRQIQRLFLPIKPKCYSWDAMEV